MPKGHAVARAGVLGPEACARDFVIAFDSDEQARRGYCSERRRAARKPRQGAAEIEPVPAEGV